MKRPEESPKPKTNAFKSGGFKSADMSETTQASGLGLYEVIVNKQASKGYGVQIGVFSSYKKVLDQADKFNRKYSKKTLIHIDTHNGSTVYKLLLGVFESRSDASFFRNDLRKDNTDGLIKDLSVMGFLSIDTQIDFLYLLHTFTQVSSSLCVRLFLIYNNYY
jgi:hypothetical protein